MRQVGCARRGLCLFLTMVAGTVLFGLSGCQTQDDAVAAAQQMAETAATMQTYYATLDSLITKTVEVQRAQSDFSGVALDAATRGLIEQLHPQIAKRTLLANRIAELAASFADLSGSHAADDAGKAAVALDKELVTTKALPGLTDTQLTALQAAVTTVVNVFRAHGEVKAAQQLKPFLVALCSFFDSEKDVYVSVSRSYYQTAASNAKALIDGDQVAIASRYVSSLQPFGLKPSAQSVGLRKAARDDMKAGVDDALAQREQESAQAADALSDALHRMQARVDTVASHGPLRVRVPPLSLESVKTWIAGIQAQTGVN